MEFHPIRDAQKIRDLLKKSISGGAYCVWWIKDYTVALRSEILEYSPLTQLFALSIPKAADRKRLNEEVKKNRECQACVYLKNNAVLCFKLTLFTIEPDRIRFKGPEFIYKIQRRKEFRIPIPKGYDVPIEFSHPENREVTLQSPVLDLSNEGISFEVPEAWVTKLSRGMHIEHAAFTLWKRRIETPIEIEHHVKQKTGEFATYRVGARFTALSEEDGDFIAIFIAEQIVLNNYPVEGYVKKVVSR